MDLWFTARGAGLAALLLLSISTAIGALVSGRGAKIAAGRVVVQYLHRVTASLGIGVLALHIGTILADSYAHVGVTGAIIPFTSGYRATWVGLGTIAAYCFVLAGALGFARGRMAGTPRGAAIWRGLHGAAYLGWALAVVHGYLSGTDRPVAWVQGLFGFALALVAVAVAVRVVALVRPGRLVRHPAATRRDLHTADITRPDLLTGVAR
jgi:methionine sulfoxide reductase heme-binding subunit